VINDRVRQQEEEDKKEEVKLSPRGNLRRSPRDERPPVIRSPIKPERGGYIVKKTDDINDIKRKLQMTNRDFSFSRKTKGNLRDIVEDVSNNASRNAWSPHRIGRLIADLEYIKENNLISPQEADDLIKHIKDRRI